MIIKEKQIASKIASSYRRVRIQIPIMWTIVPIKAIWLPRRLITHSSLTMILQENSANITSLWGKTYSELLIWIVVYYKLGQVMTECGLWKMSQSY